MLDRDCGARTFVVTIVVPSLGLFLRRLVRMDSNRLSSKGVAAMSMSSEAWKVVSAFQRFVKHNDKSEIKSFTLAELQNADQQLGSKDSNAGFRIALRNQIADLQLKDQRKHESGIRAWQIVVGVIVALAITGLTKLVFGS